VLNLFSYTGGFGLCAASGAAAQVVNVDTSKKTLAWAQRNAARNNLSMECITSDAREYLKRSRKQNLTFDRIVCDPPSFARSKKGIWKIEKDLPDLIRLLTPLLAPGGIALISSNFEGWSYKRYTKTIGGALTDGITLEPALELPEWLRCAPNPDLLKACFLKRRP
jgi:23S rRNA (cytosine1962-C5)-methyltransferase